MTLLQFLQSIDWVFASVLLIGGRYWGSKFFSITKNKDLNFLFFATAFGVVWLIIRKLTGVFDKTEAGNIFLTYLFTTSFYQLLAKKLFKIVEDKIKSDE